MKKMPDEELQPSVPQQPEKLSELDQTRLSLEKHKLQLANREYQLFVLKLFANYKMTGDDVIQENGAITRKAQ